MALALLAVTLLGAVALTASVRRPRNGADPEVLRVDDAVRRRSAESVVASIGAATAASLTGVGMVVGMGLATRTHAPVSLQAAGWIALAVALAALVLLVWCLVVLLLPSGAPHPHGRIGGGPGAGAPPVSPAPEAMGGQQADRMRPGPVRR